MSDIKLRCSGQANGCTRCRTISVTCTYSASGPDGKPRKRGAAGKNAERSGTNAISSQPTSIPPYTNSIPRTQESGPRSEVVTDVEGDNAAGFEEDFSLADQMLQDLLPQYTSPCADNCMPSPNFNLAIDSNQDMLFSLDSTIDTSLFTPDHDMCMATASVLFFKQAKSVQCLSSLLCILLTRLLQLHLRLPEVHYINPRHRSPSMISPIHQRSRSRKLNQIKALVIHPCLASLTRQQQTTAPRLQAQLSIAGVCEMELSYSKR